MKTALKGHQLLAAVFRSAYDDQIYTACHPHTHITINFVCPKIDVFFEGKVPLLPFCAILDPDKF